jgi:DNA polymerase-3 subunit epsilon
MREIVLDTETTGLNHKGGDRIIEVACVELINHVATNKHLQFYCSTDRAISDEAIKIHGLSNEFLEKFPKFKESAQSLLNFIKEDTLIIHNADFDLGFINNELKIAGFMPLKNKFVDTVSLARKTLNTRIANLDYLCRRFSIDLSARKLHGALLDCQLLSEVYLELQGGRQTNLALKDSYNNDQESKHKKETQRGKVYRIQISSEEIQKHKKFVASLSGSLWNKIDY